MAKLLRFSAIFLLLQTVLIGAEGSKKCKQEILEKDADEKVPSAEIVKLIDQVRQQLVDNRVPGQPRAKKESMKKMVWNSDLSREALKVAKTCLSEPVNITTKQFPGGLGQTIFKECWKTKEAIDWNEVVEHWFKTSRGKYEFDKFSIDKHQFFTTYTQLVWGDSNNVGCADVIYKRFHPKTPFCGLAVCHYGPAGNIEGQFPYIKA